jgi:hypothetical protein
MIDAEWELTARLYAEGKSAVEIGWTIGRTDSCVRNRLRAMGIFRPVTAFPKKLTQVHPETLHRLYERDGLSFRAIGVLLGASAMTVKRRCAELGIVARRPGPPASRQGGGR